MLATIMCALLFGCVDKITLDKQFDGIDKLTSEHATDAIVDRAAIKNILSPFAGLRVTRTDDRAKDTRTPIVTGYVNDIKYLEISVDDNGRAYVVFYDNDGEFEEYCSAQQAIDRAALIETIKNN